MKIGEVETVEQFWRIRQWLLLGRRRLVWKDFKQAQQEIIKLIDIIKKIEKIDIIILIEQLFSFLQLIDQFNQINYSFSKE